MDLWRSPYDQFIQHPLPSAMTWLSSKILPPLKIFFDLLVSITLSWVVHSQDADPDPFVRAKSGHNEAHEIDAIQAGSILWPKTKHSFCSLIGPRNARVVSRRWWTGVHSSTTPRGQALCPSGQTTATTTAIRSIDLPVAVYRRRVFLQTNDCTPHWCGVLIIFGAQERFFFQRFGEWIQIWYGVWILSKLGLIIHTCLWIR